MNNKPKTWTKEDVDRLIANFDYLASKNISTLLATT